MQHNISNEFGSEKLESGANFSHVKKEMENIHHYQLVNNQLIHL